MANAKKALIAGDEYYNQQLYYYAVKEYRKANNLNGQNGLLCAKLADCYMQTSDYEKAYPLIQKAVKLNSELDGYYYYVKGYLEQYKGNFDPALKAYFEAKDRGSDLVRNFDDMIISGILECKSRYKIDQSPFEG